MMSGLLVLACCAGSARAFSLLGPPLAWQTTDLAYMKQYDIGGPMELTAGYRWNVPVIYYAFDESFIRYFGQQGMKAVDQAMKILNDLPAMTSVTNDGARLFYKGRPYPMSAVGTPNGQALAAGLHDVKSHALMLVLEEMGLAEPQRYSWTLRARATGTVNNTPVTNYSVRVLNFDPISLRPTNRVNSIYYGYTIQDPVPNETYAEAVEQVSLNPDDLYFYSAVADGIVAPGYFFTGLSADDVGGLRYLYNRNNVVSEGLSPGVTAPSNLTNIVSSPWLPISYNTNASNLVAGFIPSAWIPYLSGTNTGFLNNTNVVVGTNLGLRAIVLAGTTNTATLVTNGLRPGVNHFTFRKVVYDTLIGQTLEPVTNRFIDQVITNRTLVLQPVERIVSQPDILFVAEDLGLANDNYTPVLTWRTDTAGWQNNDAINGQAVNGGPGVIVPAGGTNTSVRISFTDQLPYVINRSPVFITESPYSAGWGGYWGSFDGTTNAPMVYPDYGGIKIGDLVDKIVTCN